MERNTVTVIAGANGSGKTTFAKYYMELKPQAFLNADEIAFEIAGKDYASVQLKAGKEYFRRLKKLRSSGKDFMFESTLSGKTVGNLLKEMKLDGYEIQIIYLLLETPDVCVARVKERVKAGGHHVPEADIIRRYNRSRTNFWGKYRLLADSWHMYYNSDDRFDEVASGSGENFQVNSPDLLEIFMRGLVK